MFPISGAPMEADAHFQALLNMSFRVPTKGPLSQGVPPSWSPSQRDAPFLEPSFIYLSNSPVYEPLPDSMFCYIVKGPLWREMPISRGFLNISSRVPIEGGPPSAPSMEPLQREMLHP